MSSNGAFWPIGNLIAMRSVSPTHAPDDAYKALRPYQTSCNDLFQTVVGLTPKVLLAALLLPSFMAPLLSGAAETYSWSWIAPIVARDLIGSFVICAGWEHILYSSTLAPKLAKYKMNLKMPRNYNEQIAHDQVFTFFCVLCASAVEVWALHTYAIGGFGTTWRDGFWGAGAIFNVLWVATTTYWRLTHFWFIHRGMHPWFKKGSAVGKYFPDIGKLMYTHVHKLHHYSYNPTTWSGLSMHPVEGTIYFTAALIPALLGGAHPYLFILCKLCLSIDSVRCYSRERHSVYHPALPSHHMFFFCNIIVQWVAHDGFGPPSAGVYFHFLHHAHYNCNYGDTVVPFDWLFGSFMAAPPQRGGGGQGKGKGGGGSRGGNAVVDEADFHAQWEWDQDDVARSGVGSSAVHI
jgi:sterol desaturase/sphingolipid hydroxylase (fatty acid hydroxylase superfamily)